MFHAQRFIICVAEILNAFIDFYRNRTKNSDKNSFELIGVTTCN